MELLLSVIHCCTISRVKSAAKVLLFSGLTKDFARKREEKCQILKIGNYSGAKRWKIFSPASRELLPTRCGGTAKEKILKKVHIAINIKIYTEFLSPLCSERSAEPCYVCSAHSRVALTPRNTRRSVSRCGSIASWSFSRAPGYALRRVRERENLKNRK